VRKRSVDECGSRRLPDSGRSKWAHRQLRGVSLTAPRSAAYLEGLVRELCKLTQETEWAEFKVGNDNPQAIGEYISAPSNAAALTGKTRGYLLWGVRDDDHAIVGTTFDPRAARKGNEELESWLLRLLTPRIDFRFYEVELDGERLVLLEIDRAARHPVAFSGIEYVRVGTYKKKLKDYPEKERALWRLFDQVSFEQGVAADCVSAEHVLLRLDYPAYFHLLGVPLPDGRDAILDALASERLIARCEAGGFDITHLGAVLFARRLDDFGRLGRKALRVIVYRGTGPLETEREHIEVRGYAAAFEAMLAHIMAVLPAQEEIEHGLRRAIPAYPEIAVRELIANALIHQDFSVGGAGPMVEIFDGRIEVTNPGDPLVAPDRFLDSPPASRNEDLASLMRRFNICEERGSGIDKVVAATETARLPPPRFQAPPGFTKVTLFASRPLSAMDRSERVRALYLHSGLMYLNGGFLTNASVRERFRITFGNRAMASRLIRSALDQKAIALHDPDAAPSQRKYVPWWAVEVCS